jgi:hypothetical protein
MRALLGWTGLLGMQGILLAEEAWVPRKWPDALQALESIQPETIPKTPQTLQVPDGPVVLHGDLFGDGRHLALVGRSDTTLLAGDKSGWKTVSGHEVDPAWTPAGKEHEDAAHYNIGALTMPFVLKDLNGDEVPEVLVAFNNDGYQRGYAIAKKKGSGIEFLKVRSEQGEPEFRRGFLVVSSNNSGRKSWWGGWSYYRWEDGLVVPAAVWVQDGRDPEVSRWIVVRCQAEKGDRAFEVLMDEDGVWKVRSVTWTSGVEVSDSKEFATIRISVGPAQPENMKSDFAADALVFELIAGVTGALWKAEEIVGEGFNYAKESAKLKVEIEGSEEAKDFLKRRSPGPR